MQSASENYGVTVVGPTRFGLVAGRTRCTALGAVLRIAQHLRRRRILLAAIPSLWASAAAAAIVPGPAFLRRYLCPRSLSLLLSVAVTSPMLDHYSDIHSPGRHRAFATTVFDAATA